MLRKITFLILVLALGLIMVAPVAADAPNFGPAIYADGKVWGTKGTTDLPPPNEHNKQSFDKLFAFTNGAEGQLPVAEAAPGNPAYNGGRWWSQSVEWNITPPAEPLKSYAEIQHHEDLGDLTITPETNYFQCPLLPVK